jgi:hypothetical protein
MESQKTEKELNQKTPIMVVEIKDIIKLDFTSPSNLPLWSRIHTRVKEMGLEPGIYAALIYYMAPTNRARTRIVEKVKRYLVKVEILPQSGRFVTSSVFPRSGGAGESHPHALTDPYVSLSAHTAPLVQPT